MIRLALLGLLLATGAGAATTYVHSNVVPPPIPREFRGVWVATLNNIDWPSKRGLPTAQQQEELIALLDKCVALKLNVVIFQVRPGCDAFYASKLEPWSEYLTGTQGQPPNPFWDPLEFAVTEAHRRGLELHAWFNPFRARHSTASKTASAGHVSRTHPEWVRAYGSQAWLDPGLAEVQNHSVRVILDVVQRYDVDGVHMDDYFYPYPEPPAGTPKIPFPDAASWKAYQSSSGTLSREDWRRENVNRFIARIHREVHAAKPWVRVGISPFGIYRPGFPAGIKGLDQYESLYADPKLWLAQGWLDYLAPQLYWRTDAAGQSFPVLLKWWAENNPRQLSLVAGLNTTAIAPSGWPASEIEKQIALGRRQPGVVGHIHWNMSALLKNKGGIDDVLVRNFYAQPALAPAQHGGAKATAPKTTARVTGSRVDFDVAPISGTDLRYWIIQTRREDGTWDTRTELAHDRTWTRSPSPALFAIRSVDKFGNLSDATVLQRTEIQPRKETPPPGKAPVRRGK